LLWRIDAPEVIAITWAGFLAAVFDSFLGATIQGQYKCKICGSVTERAKHCGRDSDCLRGMKWVNNDVVNFAASGAGAVTAWLLLKFYAYPI
jgi:uncharacterized membrane protein